MKVACLRLIGLVLLAGSFAANTEDSLTHYGTPEGTVLRRGSYALAFDGRTRCPRWVLERIDKATLKGASDRTGVSFKADSEISAEFRPLPRSYAGSGFDIGHQAAAADYGDQDDLKATFTLSNAVPQTPELNRAPWRMLETHLRQVAAESDVTAVWIVTMPLWWQPDTSSDRLAFHLMGVDRVHVPTHCGKAALVARGKSVELSAWILPNDAKVKGGIADLDKFRVTTDDLETVAGLDLWSALPAELQDKLEALK